MAYSHLTQFVGEEIFYFPSLYIIQINALDGLDAQHEAKKSSVSWGAGHVNA